MLNKITKFMMLILFVCMGLVSMLMLNDINNVEASEYYSYSCGSDYEVSQITSSGSFTTVACYPDFSAAKSAMKQDESYVVRHLSSKSPSKIIAMNHGVAYSYPGRKNSAVMDVFERSNLSTSGGNYKTTYVSENYEMTYFETTEYNPNNGNGTIHINLNGFDGYVELVNTDLVPEQFLDTGLSIYIGGNNKYSGEAAYELAPVRTYYRVKTNDDGIRELQFINSIAWARRGIHPTQYTLTLDRAPVGLEEGVRYYSYNGFDFYADTKYQDYVTTYYPYYQFLPLRSKSNLTAEDFDYVLNYVEGSTKSALRDSGAYFKEAEEKYGVNALLLYAMGVHESGWGESGYALNRNNLFGWTAYDSDEDQASSFASVKACVLQQAGYNLRMFLDIDNWRFFSSSLGNKGSGLNVKYASDPYWGQKICAHAYNIDKIASGSGNIKDNGKYPMSIIDEFGAKFYYEPSDQGEHLYIANYGTNYQENFVVIPLGVEGDFTKIQFTNPIENGELVKIRYVDGNVIYDFDKSYAYIRSDYLRPINVTLSHNESHNLSEFALVEDSLSIKGDFTTTDVSDTEAKVYLIDNYDNQYTLNTVVEGEKISFDGSIDLSTLTAGEYTFKIKVDYTDNRFDKTFDVKGDFKDNVYTNAGRKYEVVNKSLFTLIIREHEVNSRDIISVENINIDTEGNLYIKGLAFKTSYNYQNIDEISHKLELYNLVNGETIYSYDLNTIDSDGFSLNDGYEYQYVGFEGSFDISNLVLGNYGLRINVSNADMNFVANLSTTNKEFSNLYTNVGDLTFRYATNQIYRYRLEIDVIPNVYDLSLINKPTIRPSIVSIDNLSISDGKLIFKGASFMKFANFGLEDNVNISFDLLSKTGEKIDVETKKVPSEFDYTTAVGNGYDLNDVGFAVEFDVTGLANGTYEIVTELSTNEYYDLFTLTDSRNLEYDGYVGNDKSYSIVVSEDRYRVYLVVEDLINPTIEITE